MKLETAHGFIHDGESFSVIALGRLLCGSLALVAPSNGLRITLDNHGLEGRHLLFIPSLIDIG